MPPESSSRSSRKRSRQEYIPQIVIPDSDDLFGSPSPAPEARPAKKQRRFTRQETSSSSTSQAAAQQSSKARRTSAVKKQPGLKKEQAEEERLPDFGDSDDDRDGNDEIIDLLGSDDVAPLPVPRPPKEDNMVKLGKFQCVICMDDCTDLTVTHCGHLFCSECLHSSLHIDATKKICPICRQKVDTNPSAGRFTNKSKGFWPLELKVMTKKRSEKRAAR